MTDKHFQRITAHIVIKAVQRAGERSFRVNTVRTCSHHAQQRPLLGGENGLFAVHRYCTVGRTLEHATPVSLAVVGSA